MSGKPPPKSEDQWIKEVTHAYGIVRTHSFCAQMVQYLLTNQAKREASDPDAQPVNMIHADHVLRDRLAYCGCPSCKRAKEDRVQAKRPAQDLLRFMGPSQFHMRDLAEMTRYLQEGNTKAAKAIANSDHMKKWIKDGLACTALKPR